VRDLERCDQCGIRLAPADPHNPEDSGPRCSACVRAHGPVEPAESTSRQLELELEPLGGKIGMPGCKETGCTARVVGSSITGTGHVCARHNEIEWSRALAANGDGYYHQLGRDLLRDAGARP
jgi:hypothetical protein